MTRLSVNINKVATIRNARGGNVPDVVRFAQDCERFGAEGITVHPRPDERHIRYRDVYDLKPVVTTEFNIEGNPRGERDHKGANPSNSQSKPYGFIDLVKEIRPTQVTLVPDAEGVLTRGEFQTDVLRSVAVVLPNLGKNGRFVLHAGIEESIYLKALAYLLY